MLFAVMLGCKLGWDSNENRTSLLNTLFNMYCGVDERNDLMINS